jgi:hypothetical protein
MTLDRREVVAVDVPVALSTLWHHVREPELIHRWYRSDRPSLDEEIQGTFIRQARESIDTEGDRVVHRLIWPHGDILTAHASHHDPGHTHVTFKRASFQGLHTNTYDGVWDTIDELWISGLHQLEFALRVHPGEDRRTLAVRDLDAGDRGDRLLDRAGLRNVRGTPTGGHVEGRRPDGVLLGGTVLYKAPLQFGVQLHGLDEHLLVVHEIPVAERPPHGAVSATLHTYGLDDARFAEVSGHWDAWWRKAVPVPA